MRPPERLWSPGLCWTECGWYAPFGVLEVKSYSPYSTASHHSSSMISHSFCLSPWQEIWSVRENFVSCEVNSMERSCPHSPYEEIELFDQE